MDLTPLEDVYRQLEIMVSNVDTYLFITKLSSGIQNYDNPTTTPPGFAAQMKAAAETLQKIDKFLTEAVARLNSTTIPRDCSYIASFRTLMQAVLRVPGVVTLVHEHAHDTTTSAEFN